MAQSSRTFRIIFNSTFSGLEAERNALQKWAPSGLRNLTPERNLFLVFFNMRYLRTLVNENINC